MLLSTSVALPVLREMETIPHALWLRVAGTSRSFNRTVKHRMERTLGVNSDE